MNKDNCKEHIWKKRISVGIVIGLLGGIYIDAQAVMDYYGKEESVVELSDEDLEQIKSEMDSFLHSSVVSDFLCMDSDNLDFENIYDKNQLYEENILYCDMNAWRYHGTQLDAFQNPEDYYDVTNIAALRYILDDTLYGFVDEKHAETVFRFTWEQGIVEWIDEEHIVCYMIDWTPQLIHLETNRIEDIERDAGDYDSYGVEYEISGDQLIAENAGEEVYRWDIMKENQEVYIMKLQ